MNRRTWSALGLAALGSCLATPCAADVVDPSEREPPGYRVHFVDRGALAGRTLVAVGAGLTYAHGDHEPGTSYTILDEFAVVGPRRVCAVPSEWVIDSPVGALGPPMLRGARSASGAITTGQEQVQEVLALFDRDEVACAPMVPPQLDRADIEAVDEAYRATTVQGRTLQVTLVEVGYQIHGETTTIAAGPGGSRPPPPPIRSSSCACRTGRGEPRLALSLGIALALLLGMRRLSGAASDARARRRPHPAHD